MNEFRNISIHSIATGHSVLKSRDCDPAESREDHVENTAGLAQLPGSGLIINSSENLVATSGKARRKKESGMMMVNDPGSATPPATAQHAPRLFRLFVKNGEYVYARPNDIIMMESCDHLVKVYLAFNDKIKKTIRHNTLKDFLLQLPSDQFMRIGRFCAVNMHRLSGGNCNEQTFEFDFRISIKLKHAISHTAFYTIGK